ncbi:hypothetical protein HYT17_02345 [Candidatus Microgenomates bacterium]|nr:hypothetical protein [Candidatus Microgenomates bacterium]
MRILLVLLGTTVIGFFILTLAIGNISKDASEKKKQLVQLEKDQKVIPVLSANLSAKSDSVSLLQEAFPAKKDFVSVVSFIDSLAAGSLVLAEFHFESEELVKDGNGNPVMPVSITVEGDYPNVVRFLSGIINGKYLFAISRLDADSPTGIKGKNKIIMRANLYASAQ